MKHRLFAWTAAIAFLAGCGGDDASTEFDHYFATKGYDEPACNRPDPRLTGRRELRIFTQGVDAPVFTRSLQRYYLRYGLTFFSTKPIQVVDQRYAIDTDQAALLKALQSQFPGVDFNDQTLETKDPALYQRVVRAVMNFMFKPLVDFARAHPAGAQVTNLVLVPQILKPGGTKVAPQGAEVAGLAISPALLSRFEAMDLAEGSVWKVLDLPPDFTPIMFLDAKVLANIMAVAPELVDLVAAHEFGHTGALIHRQESHNLMLPGVRPGVSSCTDALDDDQIQTMRATLGLASTKALLADHGRDAPSQQIGVVLPGAELAAITRGDRQAMLRLVRRLAD